MSSSCNQVISANQRDELYANWIAYAATVVEPLLRIARPADWSAQLSPTSSSSSKNGGNANVVTDTPSDKLRDVFEKALIAVELADEGAFEAYEKVILPFVDAHSKIRDDMAWIEKPTADDLDWIAVSEFVKNNGNPSVPADGFSRHDMNLNADSYFELGTVNNKKVYAIKFIKSQYVDANGNRRVDSNTIPTRGTFGYVVEEDDGFQSNLNAKLNAIPLSAVKNKEFREIAGATIYLEFVLRFIISQKVGFDGSDYVGPTILVKSDALPDFETFHLPLDAYSAWLTTVGDSRSSRIRLIEVNENEGDSIGVKTAQDPTLTTATTIDTSAASAANAAAEAITPAPEPPVAKLSRSATGFLISATIATVIGIIALIFLLIKMFTSKSGSPTFTDTGMLGGVQALEVF